MTKNAPALHKADPRARTAFGYWGDMKMPDTKSDFFNAITTPAPVGDGTVATIRLYGPIDSWGGFWGVSAKDVGTVLDALSDSVAQIVLRINSPGGEVFEGLAILNMFRAHKAKVTAVVDGMAGSAASFIAAGCDETVMSPGTQMIIHSPSGFSFGNATDLRKDAEFLDSLQAGIIEIYAEKAPKVQNWDELLGEETYLTAAATVELGLADRVGVVPDAGETSTAGDDEPEIVLVPLIPDDDGEADDRLSARITRLHNRAPVARTPEPPSQTESGKPNRKDVTMSDSLTAGLRERLGVTDAAASEETLLAALDEALEERADPTPPAGTVLMDAAQLTELRNNAAAGVQALAAQATARREGIVDAALRDGRIAASTRQTWLDQLDANEEGTTALLATLTAGTVPVATIGHADGKESSEDDAVFNKLFGADQKEAS
jgi:ATP-dependent protease ClpP protease subunit